MASPTRRPADVGSQARHTIGARARTHSCSHNAVQPESSHSLCVMAMHQQCHTRAWVIATRFAARRIIDGMPRLQREGNRRPHTHSTPRVCAPQPATGGQSAAPAERAAPYTNREHYAQSCGTACACCSLVMGAGCYHPCCQRRALGTIAHRRLRPCASCRNRRRQHKSCQPPRRRGLRRQHCCHRRHARACQPPQWSHSRCVPGNGAGTTLGCAPTAN